MKIIITTMLVLMGLNAWAGDNVSQKISFGLEFNSGLMGASFDSPNEAGWNIKHGGIEVTLTKGDPASDGSSMIEGYLITLDVPLEPLTKFIDNIKKNITAGYANDKTFSLVTLDVAQYKREPRCVRVHMLLERKNPAADGAGEKRFSERHALSCGLSPSGKSGIEIVYDQRYRESGKDPAFREKADRLFDSVVLGPEG
jgi:hypothetical protein